MYLVESRVSSLAKVFAILAILITVLGVFSLASYTAEQRTKEIGIQKSPGRRRKASGQSFPECIFEDHCHRLCGTIPVAWFAAYKWLQNFVYRTSIDPLVFGISLVLLLAITLLTVSYEILKSVRTSPVKSLRTE